MSTAEKEEVDRVDNDKDSSESSSTSSFEKIDNDEGVDNRMEIPAIPDIMKPTEYEVEQAVDPFLKPLSEEQLQFYREESSNRAVNTLILFSLLMFSLPFIVMAVTYYYLFQDYFGLPPDKAMLYAGLCGVLCVFVIIFWFIKIAYDEEKQAELELKSQKKNE